MRALGSGLVIRGLLFLFTFTLEVHVRADTLKLENVKIAQEQPAGCWAKVDSACAVKTREGETTTLKFGEAILVLDQKTVVARSGPGEVRLVAGQLWLRSSTPVTVRTEYGAFVNEASTSDFWISRSAEGRVTGSAVQGKLLMRPRGSSSEIEIPAGLENWVTRVDTETGQARFGIPTAINFKEHLLRWAKLYPGNKADFEKEAQAFHQGWTEAAREAADLHQNLFDRKVAGVEAQEKRQLQATQAKDAANRELRELFRKRVFEE